MVSRAVFAGMLLLAPTAARAAPLMIVGDDEKVVWDRHGDTVLKPTGNDSVLIVDLAEPENPRIAVQLSLENSVVGPPTNLALAPGGSSR